MMSITKTEAEVIARELLKSLIDPEIPVEVLHEATMERDYGWLFFYQSKRYLETGIIRDALMGNGPILVDKLGKALLLPSAFSVEESLKRYEAGLPLNPRRKV